jgi:SAM-dependent methyltransferase
MQENSDPKGIVARGYGRIQERHRQWVSKVRNDERDRYTSVLLRQLPPGANLLELGCGVGLPTTRNLAEQLAVTGVDISAKQIAHARQNVPEAEFLCADMSTLDYPDGNFDGIAAFYSIFHVPRREQPGLLRKIVNWLRPGGIFVGTMGSVSTEAGHEDDWLGAPMYWSSFDAETNRELARGAGLQLLSTRLETADEFGEPVTFLWVVACRPEDSIMDPTRAIFPALPVEVLNFQEISPTIGTAGQPLPEQFASIREAGYEVVVNLAMPDSPNALANEASIVTGHGMDYVHIPVVFESPTVDDLERFFETMVQHRCRRVFVHCALNWRVSVFALLYSVLYLGVPFGEAKKALDRIWTPDDVWQPFLEDSLTYFRERLP